MQLDENGKCVYQIKFSILLAILSILNNLRPMSAQRFFFALEELEKYQYHKTNYTATLRSVLEQLNDM